MTFVYPILLGGLIFAGLPVLLHFLVRNKPKTLAFPAFRFLVQKQRSNTRKLRLRQLLLMLLRVALLILLCLALSRPRLSHEDFGLSRERPVALILVFDTSPSMQYKINDLTRLELARKRCLELLDEMPEDCRILIIDSAEPGSRAEWLKSVNKARQKINSLTIRANNASVTQAVDEALRHVEEWERQDDDPAAQRYPRFLCVFSDRTQACWDRSQALVVQKKLERAAAVKMQTLFFDVGIDEPADLAITLVQLPVTPEGEMRQSFGQGEIIPLRVVVKRSGEKISNDLLCQLGDHKLTQTFQLQANEEQTLTLEVDTAAWKLGPGFHQAELKLATTTDALPFNNQRFVTFKVRDKQPVLVLADDVKKTQRFAWALEDLNYAVDFLALQGKTDFDLDKYAAVFLVGVAAPAEKLWQALTGYAQKGGGVGILPPGDELKHTDYNSEAAQKIMPARIGKKTRSEEKGGSAWDLDDLQPAFLAPYRVWLDDPRCDFVKFQCRATFYWEVQPLKEPDVAVVVRYDEDKPSLPPAVVERSWPKSGGKVLLLTTPLDQRQPLWNDYQEERTSFYLALTKLCARRLCKDAENPPLNYLFGTKTPLKAQAEAYPKFILSGTDFTEEIRFDKERFIDDSVPRAGNYKLAGTTADKQELKVLDQFSVNIPAEESDLRRVAVADIEAVLGKNCVIPQDRNTSLLASLPQYWNEPVELFPWLMVLLLFFLAVENLLANRFYRREAADV